jgi:hypothetical protein
MPATDATDELSACEDAGFISLTSSDPFELVVRVDVTDPKRVFEISWSNFLSMAVRSEHFCQWDNDEVWTGKHVFRTYTKSKFLDFVDAATFATSDFPGPFVHYQIQSLYQIIDVASQHPPRITRVDVA